MSSRSEMVKSFTSSSDKIRKPDLSITIDKDSSNIQRPKNISPRNRVGSVEVFPPIVEESVIKKPGLKYPLSPKTFVQEPNIANSKSPATSLSSVTVGGRKTPVSNGTSLVRNHTFKGMGNFTTVLKAKMAFKNKAKRFNIETVAEDDDVIVELPKEPRFSTSMSPEAQYAMMKGYEDTVYNYLCKEYPEYRLALKRNKTPLSKVDIKQKENKQDARKDSSSGESQDHNQGFQDINGSEESHSISTDSSSASPVSGSSFTFSSSSSTRLTRRASMPATYISNQKMNKANSLKSSPFESTLTRAKSLPNVIPLEKQLVLSYRLQSAMDILDTVRNGLGYNYTSPRVKAQRTKIKPVVDYNKWASVWGREFNVQDKFKST